MRHDPNVRRNGARVSMVRIVLAGNGESGCGHTGTPSNDTVYVLADPGGRSSMSTSA